MLPVKVEPIEQQLIDVLESMDEAFFILDKNFIIMRANKNFEKVSNVTRKESIGRNLWDVFPHTAQPSSPYWINYHKVITEHKRVSFTDLNRHNSWVQITAYPTSSGGIFVFVTDITAKVRAEEALRESEKRFRALVSAASSVVYRMSPDWSEMCELDGRGVLEDTGFGDKDWLQKYIPKHEQNRMLEAISEAIEKKDVFQLEHQILHADGTMGWTFTRAIPIFGDDGGITEWFGVAADITEQVKTQEERRRQQELEHRMELLTEQRNALLKINQTKDEFVSLASHQLRTPATAVKQFIGMLMDDFAGPLTPPQKRLVQSAYESNERELCIINDLLKTAQLDGNISNLATGKYDIINLLQDVMDDLIPTLQQRKQKIQFLHKGKGAKIIMDTTEIKLAFSNLIENASKYSSEGSVITVRVTPSEKFVDVDITDHGIGISSENHKKVFDKFTRVINQSSKSVEGSGLGLYWVKQIIEMHKGEVSLRSEIGKGSTFTVRLPKTIS